MHPDLFMRMYQQQERELERRLEHRLAARQRSASGQSHGHLGRTVHLHLHWRNTH